jgi:DNA-binding NarL/FixJ family response regulator
MRKLLLADDSASHRRIVKNALRDIDNIEITEVADGRQAVEAAVRLQPHIIIMDLAMPGLNGAEATIALKKLLPNVRIILFTLYGEDIGPTLASAVGADLAISKSNGLDTLTQVVNQFLSRDIIRRAEAPGTRSTDYVD